MITNAAAMRAYLSYWGFGTAILDISDPVHPRYLGGTAPRQGNVHSAWLADRGRLLLETHEIEHGRPVVRNIARPAHPRRVLASDLNSGLWVLSRPR